MSSELIKLFTPRMTNEILSSFPGLQPLPSLASGVKIIVANVSSALLAKGTSPIRTCLNILLPKLCLRQDLLSEAEHCIELAEDVSHLIAF